ncbi:MAG: hypothetical protein R3A51_14610 [Nannocystaceae bacterium]|nr:hypothetical protein [Myxococcales bacterium]
MRDELADDPRRWPEALRDAWEERAAILEFDAGLPRARAEREARRMVLEALGRRAPG